MRSTTVVISDNARHLRGTGGEAQTRAGNVTGHSAAHPEGTPPQWYFVRVISRSRCLLHESGHTSPAELSLRMAVMFHLL